MLINEEIKEHFKRLCIAANHTLTRDEYRKLNNNKEYSSGKIEALWGNWTNFIVDISHTINFNRYIIRKDIDKNTSDIVITSVIDGSDIDFDCFYTLINYCKEENCQLYILWNKALKNNAHFSKEEYDILSKYLVTELNFEKDPRCKAVDLLISPTIKNPLSNLDKISKGLDTIIVGSPKQYLDILPYDQNSAYKLAVSTGTISKPCYKSNIQGILDEQNHMLGGLRLYWNTTAKRYNVRELQYKNNCIYDITMKAYTKNKVSKISEVPAVVLGDLHAPETDMTVLNSTIDFINATNPKEVMIHDWMSYQSINHHEQNKVLTKLLNTTEETKSLEDELNCSLKIMNDLATKCKKSKFNIVASNHDEFLIKWLNQGEFAKSDPVNRIIGCELFANIAKGKNIFEGKFVNNIRMLDCTDTFKVEGFELAKHGDAGIAGAKGNPLSYIKSYDKSVTGHTHSPKIRESSVVVGTLSKLQLSYNRNSISNWAHANCILYKNESFQLIFE